METAPAKTIDERCTVYTANTRCAGTIRSQHPLLLDQLNQQTDVELTLFDAYLAPLQRIGPGANPPVEYAEIRRDAVIMVIPERSGTHAVDAVSSGHEHAASVLAWPFALKGRYVPLKTDDAQAPERGTDSPLRGRREDEFIPVFDCEVVYTPSPLLTFHAPVVLVNHSAIEVFAAGTISLPGSTSALPGPMTQTRSVRVGTARERREGEPIPTVEAVVPSGLGTVLGGERSGVGDPSVLAALEHIAEEDVERIEVSDLFGMLDKVGLLTGIPGEGLRRTFQELRAAKTVDWRTFLPDEVVFRQGELGEVVYLVGSGSFDVIVHGHDDNQIALAVLKAGDIFGEMAVLGDHTRTATIRARSPAKVLTIYESGFRHLLREHPELTERLFQVMSVRRSQTEARLEEAE